MGFFKVPIRKTKPKKKKGLDEAWEELVKRHSQQPKFARSGTAPLQKASEEKQLQPQRNPGRAFDATPALKKPAQQYTGTEMIGISVVHKSHLAPVFSQEQAEELAKMRRG